MSRRKYHPADFGDRPWRRLLDYALERADKFECTIPYRIVVQDPDTAPLWPHALEAFRPALIDRYASLIRWDRVRDGACEYLAFAMTGTTVAQFRAYLREPRRLEDWAWDNGRPEDPAFSRGGVMILSTESVSGRIAVFASDEEVGLLGTAGIRLLEPLGVEAEPWPTP